MIHHPQHGFPQGTKVTGLDEAAGVMGAHLLRAVHIIDDDRYAAQQGLGDGTRKPFAITWVDQGVGCGQQPGNLGGLDETRVDDPVTEVELGDALQQPVTPPAIADPQEPEFLACPHDRSQ